MNLSHLIELKNFNVFPEYFLGISALYILIVVFLISYNMFGLILQKSISECIGLTLLLVCYLILNDDIITSSNNFSFYFTLGFYKSYITDYFGFFSKFIVCFFSAFYFFIISDFLKEYKLTSFEYLILLVFAVLGLLLLCSSNDLLTAYLSIELVSLSSYILAAFKKNSTYSVEAGIKYLIVGAISSSFFLLGSSFLYTYIGSIYITDFLSILSDETWLNLESFYWQELYKNWYYPDPTFDSNILSETVDWYKWIEIIYVAELTKFKEELLTDILTIKESLNVLEPFVEIGLTFIILSLFIKLALAPFHIWSLDVYEGSPTISTFFFAVITKLSLFVFLIRICYIATIRYQEFFQFYGIIISLLSIFVGSFGGLRQRKLKTLLAYSSISHMGYVLLALSAGSVLGVEIVLFYMIIYIISSICVWFIILALNIKKKHCNEKFNRELGDLVLLRKSNPALAISLTLTMFSIAGIPPLVGFFAKIAIFLSILHVKYYFVALFSIFCTVVSTFYYIRIIKVLYFENILIGKLYYPISTLKTILLSSLLFLLIFLFVNPTFLFLLGSNAVWLSFFILKDME